MPIPAAILVAVTQIVIRLAPLAYKAGLLIRKKEIVHIGKGVFTHHQTQINAWGGWRHLTDGADNEERQNAGGMAHGSPRWKNHS